MSVGLYLFLLVFVTHVIILTSDKEFRLEVQKNIHITSLCSALALFNLSQYERLKIWLVNPNKASSASGCGLELFLLPEALLSVLFLFTLPRSFLLSPSIFLIPHWSPALNFW